MSKPIYRDDLERVYALIEKPERWTQGCSAKNEAGEWVFPESANACRWCVIGAFMKFGLAEDWVTPTRLLLGDEEVDRLLKQGLTGGAAEFNDSHTHAEVLSLLRSAIERAPVRSPPSPAGVV